MKGRILTNTMTHFSTIVAAEQISSVDLHTGMANLTSIPFCNVFGGTGNFNVAQIPVSWDTQGQAPFDVVMDGLRWNDTVSGDDASHHKVHQIFVVKLVISPVEEDSHPLVSSSGIVFFSNVSSIWIVEHSLELGALLCFLCDWRGVNRRDWCFHGGNVWDREEDIGKIEQEERSESRMRQGEFNIYILYWMERKEQRPLMVFNSTIHCDWAVERLIGAFDDRGS